MLNRLGQIFPHFYAWPRSKKRAALLISLLLLLIYAHPAYADIAPPAQPPGANPEPGSETTQVRMLAETVLIEVQATTPSGSLGQAIVTADFTMQNLGKQAETMAARFPVSASDGFGNFPEITDFKVYVDEQSVKTRRIMGEDPNFYADQVPWAEFDVTFPPGQDVNIRVTYTLEGTGEYPFITFTYILSTGAGWKDTIDSVDLIVRLPYEANDQNTIMEEHIGWGQTTPGASMAGNEVRWHYRNLEPTNQENLVVVMVMPSAWKKVLAELDNVSSNPRDGEAWGRLGKIYKEITFLRKGLRHDTGGLDLYTLSAQAYEQAVTLLPGDALWHAGFAELLWNHYYWEEYAWAQPSVNAEALRAMEELALSLAIEPTNEKALEMLASMQGVFPDAVITEGDKYDFLYLTETPVPPTPVEIELSAVASLTETSTLPAGSSTQTEAPSGPSLPICGTAFLVPLVMVWLVRRKVG